MKKVFGIKDLDCANCAAKLERALNRVEGVDRAVVNFMAERLTLEAPEELFEEVLKEVLRTAKRVEPDCTICVK